MGGSCCKSKHISFKLYFTGNNGTKKGEMNLTKQYVDLKITKGLKVPNISQVGHTHFINMPMQYTEIGVEEERSRLLKIR